MSPSLNPILHSLKLPRSSRFLFCVIWRILKNPVLPILTFQIVFLLSLFSNFFISRFSHFSCSLFFLVFRVWKKKWFFFRYLILLTLFFMADLLTLSSLDILRKYVNANSLERKRIRDWVISEQKPHDFNSATFKISKNNLTLEGTLLDIFSIYQ